MTTTPAETAAILMAEGFTIEQYQHIQEIRKKRLKTFEEIGQSVLIRECQKLVDFGEEVIKLMEEAEKLKPT